MHYYIQKGFTIEYLLGLEAEKKCFYMASLLKALEDRGNILKELGGFRERYRKH